MFAATASVYPENQFVARALCQGRCCHNDHVTFVVYECHLHARCVQIHQSFPWFEEGQKGCWVEFLMSGILGVPVANQLGKSLCVVLLGHKLPQIEGRWCMLSPGVHQCTLEQGHFGYTMPWHLHLLEHNIIAEALHIDRKHPIHVT